MEIYYGSKGVNNYIEAKLSREDGDFDRNAYVLKMLEGNDIGGMLKPIISKLDDCTFVRYNITAFSMLEKNFLRQRPDIEFFINILGCICDAIKEAEKYLLNPNDLVVSANYMLWDMGRNELKLIYVPFYDKDIKNQLKCFIEYIMKIFDYSSTTGTMKMHRIYDAVVSDCFDMEMLKLELGDGPKKSTKEGFYLDTQNDEFMTVPYNDDDNYGRDYKKDDTNMNYLYDDKSVEDDYEEPIYINFEEDKNEKIDKLHEVLIVVNTLIVVALSALYFMADRRMHYLIGALSSFIILAMNVLVYVLKKEKEENIDADKSMEDFKIYTDQLTKRYEESNYTKEYNDIDYDDTSYDDNNTYFSVNYKKADEKPTIKKNSSIQNKKEYKLVSLNDGMLEPIILNGDTQKITIGRGHKEVDYRLNKEQISRVHASITLSEDGIYIEDQNSTNGTYINSEKLEAFVQKSLNVGDIIKLANEEFFVS